MPRFHFPTAAENAEQSTNAELRGNPTSKCVVFPVAPYGDGRRVGKKGPAFVSAWLSVERGAIGPAEGRLKELPVNMLGNPTFRIACSHVQNQTVIRCQT